MGCGANLQENLSGISSPIPPPPTTQGAPRNPPTSGGGVGRFIKIGLMGIGALVVFIIVCIIIAAFVFGSTGTTHPASTATSVSGAAVTTIAAHTTASTSSMVDFSKVTHISASTIQKHWSSGAGYDGITVHADLRDSSDATIKWSGTTLPVDIQIYSTKFDSNYKKVKDKLVYQGTGQITSWVDGNMFMGGGIKVPYSSMNVPAGEQYGWTIVTVHTPDGKTYADTDQITALTP